MRTWGDDDSTNMDKGCRVAYDELPVVEASVIISRVTDVANNFRFNITSSRERNIFATGKTTTSSRDNHVTENETSYLATKHLVAQHVFYGKTISSRNKLSGGRNRNM